MPTAGGLPDVSLDLYRELAPHVAQRLRLVRSNRGRGTPLPRSTAGDGADGTPGGGEPAWDLELDIVDRPLRWMPAPPPRTDNRGPGTTGPQPRSRQRRGRPSRPPSRGGAVRHSGGVPETTARTGKLVAAEGTSGYVGGGQPGAGGAPASPASGSPSGAAVVKFHTRAVVSQCFADGGDPPTGPAAPPKTVYLLCTPAWRKRVGDSDRRLIVTVYDPLSSSTLRVRRLLHVVGFRRDGARTYSPAYAVYCAR